VAPHNHLNRGRHKIEDLDYAVECRATLDQDGALLLPASFTDEAIAQIVRESAPREDEAFYAGNTHNVYLTPNDASLPTDHVLNRQIISSKVLIADDQVPVGSPLRAVCDDPEFQTFLCRVLGIDAVFPYNDELSSINEHFAADGMELGWHFDNSSFAVTMLLQAPDDGGVFEYVSNVRHSASGDMAYDQSVE